MNQITTEGLYKIYKDAECIFSQQQVMQSIQRVGEAIQADLSDANPIFLIVMKGAAVFAGQLLTHLDMPLEVDYLHATRYGKETSGGVITWKVKPQSSLEGRTVVILDDILDEGHTLLSIQEYCKQNGASVIKTAVLVNKRHDRRHPQMNDADYVGLEAPDKFLFGYGMDFKEYWRNAPGIYAVVE